VLVATPDLQRLAEHATRRRLQLNLSVIRAAGMAGISKDTWKRVERGEPVRHMTYDKIEEALHWTVGSCRKILDGGEAVILDDEVEADPIKPIPSEALEVEIRDAVQGALIATTDDLTAAQIRSVNERAIEVLRSRGILPPKD
jgi:transcriptional regulator with XRE-family HTH domain